MKIINSKQYDLSFYGESDKIIILARINKKFYVWIQNSDHHFSEEEILSTQEPITDFKLAKSKFSLYEFFVEFDSSSLD